jgi:hypothetical protein
MSVGVAMPSSTWAASPAASPSSFRAMMVFALSCCCGGFEKESRRRLGGGGVRESPEAWDRGLYALARQRSPEKPGEGRLK